MGIQGHAMLILDEIDDSHPHYTMLQTIIDQVRSGSSLTKQLLGYARKGKYEIKPLNMNDLINETLTTFSRTRKEVVVHRELSEDLSPVEADRGQLEQVLLNLYINAADAMPDGGDLTLTTRNVDYTDISTKLYEPRPGDYTLIMITDKGSGMDPETQKRIFEPFFTTKQMKRGTGLGLASVYGIVKGHEGYIEVESEVGRGTSFKIYLPASEKKVEKPVETEKEIAKGSGTVLLVDDEAVILEVGGQLLTRLGYTVQTARSGRTALDLVRETKEPFDLIILDMIMPDMGGGETFDRIKEIDPAAKVILSSGYSLDGKAEEILERGCSGFLQKPFSISELSQIIQTVLG